MGQVLDLRMTGDIEQFKRFTSIQLMDKNLQKFVRRGTIKASLFLIKKVKEQIKIREFADNSPLTLLVERGTLPLLKQKNLMDAIAHKLQNAFQAEIGLIRNAESTGSRFGRKPGSNTIKMKKLVELMEEGYIINITPKMIVALIATLESQKTKRGRTKKRQAQALKKISGNLGRRGGTFRVPPRKVFTSVWARQDVRAEVIIIWREALENFWKAQGAKDGEHKDK